MKKRILRLIEASIFRAYSTSHSLDFEICLETGRFFGYSLEILSIKFQKKTSSTEPFGIYLKQTDNAAEGVG